MHRNVVVVSAFVISIGSSAAACSSDETPAGDGGGSGGGGAVGGSSTGGTAGAAGASGGVSGTTGANGGSAGANSGGTGTSGESGASGSSGAATGGGSGSAGGGGSAGTSGGAGGAGGSDGGPAGAGGRGGAATGGSSGAGGGANAMMNFFVTSDTSTTGNLGGLTAADMRCQTLAAAVGHGSKTWRAYLSVQTPTTHAINRIGEGPYYNSAGALVAMDKAALHARNGDPAVFIDERGGRVNGQWPDSPTPNQHDVLTGSQTNGMLSMGNTCGDWMTTTGNAQVGHTDGRGPGGAMTGNYVYWNGSHTAPCGDLASTGGAGKLYCFVGP